jgi:PAS domain-containing protein
MEYNFPLPEILSTLLNNLVQKQTTNSEAMEIFRHKLITNEKWIEITKQLEALKKDASDATDFVREIETGNLDAEYQGTNDSESAQKLAASLISMRDKMKKVSIEDKQRSWTNEGLAQFVEILRSNNENLESLSDNIIKNLVKYLNANQGILFLLNNDDPDDIFLEVGACYAYNRKKFLKKRIELGEGLSGQVILEKETIFMTEVPESFIMISSGLGEALPRNILIVPLKIENEVFGVIEIAGFHLFKPFEIQFIEKLSESIASTISAVRVNERTRKLLEESQFQAEQLRTQEEEIRQNMEELSSTQEEMERVMAKVQSQERYMKSILDASKDSILTIDRNFKVLNFNTNLKET